MNDRSRYLQLMQEWHCCSNDYAYIYLFFTALSAYVCFIYLSNISFKDQDFFIISIALFTAVVTFIFLKLYKTQRKNIKQINFSLKAIYIEEKKIDICYLKSITFINHVYSPYKGSTCKFCIKFTENPIIKEDIYFYMAFGKSFQRRYQYYNFEDRFITILETLAKERRELLKIPVKQSNISE